MLRDWLLCLGITIPLFLTIWWAVKSIRIIELHLMDQRKQYAHVGEFVPRGYETYVGAVQGLSEKVCELQEEISSKDNYIKELRRKR